MVIVGAGPSGCETADAVSELMPRALSNTFKRLDPKKHGSCWRTPATEC